MTATLGRPIRALVACVMLAGTAQARDAALADIAIDPAHFRDDVAAREIFAESNRQRAAASLPALLPLPAAQRMAQWQAQFMAALGSISHVNSIDGSRRNIDDRARAAGVPFRFLAENVAMNFAVEYQPRRALYTRKGAGGETIFSYSPNGPPLPFHTYGSLARALVGQWMNSAGHRRNLLSRDAQYLGCAAAPGARDTSHGLGNIFAAQVFVALR